MIIDILIEDTRWNSTALATRGEGVAAAALAHLGLAGRGYEASLLACNDARIAALNADFRGKPQPTNVLSWPSEERGAETDGGTPSAPSDPELGDIAMSYDTCAREAAEMGIALDDHAAHLVLHGLLHLLGYDHERDLDATLMEGLETVILGKLGMADPYSER